MPVDRQHKLGLIVDALKEWLPTVRVRFNEWVEACREEPALVWQTPVVRYATYTLGGIVLAFTLLGVVDLFAPGGPEPVPRARTADFHVVCSDPACGYHFVISRKFRFDSFPVQCPKCKQLTGQQARRCNSELCGGRWVAPQIVDGYFRCPHCHAVLGVAE